MDRDEAVALLPGSVGRATPRRCGHGLGGEASREWRIILKRLCDLARRSILARCRSRRLVGFDDHGRVSSFGPILAPKAPPLLSLLYAGRCCLSGAFSHLLACRSRPGEDRKSTRLNSSH